MKQRSPKMQLSFEEDEAKSRREEEKSVEEDEESDEGSSDEEEEDDDENPTDSSNFKISFRENPRKNHKSPPKQPAAAALKIPEKSVDSKPADLKNSIPTKGSPPKSPAKRLSVDTEGKESKKRRVLPEKRAPTSDEEDQQKKGRRLWDDENEIALLTAYDEHVRRGCGDNEIFGAVMKAVSGSFNIKKVKEKLRKLKIKHKTAKEKAKGRKEIVFKTPREEKLYELSEKIWGEKKDHENPPNNIAERKLNADSDARVIDEICNPIPDLKLENSANTDNHAVDDIKVMNGNGDSDIERQPVINVSAQVVDSNRDSQEKLSEYEMIGDAKSYTNIDDLVKGGLSVAAINSELQQELRELVRMKKEWQDMQLEITIRQTKLALAAIRAQKQ